MAARRVPLDIHPAEWTCAHCGHREIVTDSPAQALRHQALDCTDIPDALLTEAVVAWQWTLRLSRDELAIGAHILKHPGDREATIVPSPTWVFRGGWHPDPKKVLAWLDRRFSAGAKKGTK